MLSLILAIYGSILSTILAWDKLRKNKPKIKIDSTFELTNDFTPGIKITGFNVGYKNVSLAKVGLLINGSERMEEDMQSSDLNPGKSYSKTIHLFEGSFKIKDDQVNNGSIKYQPYFIDELNKRYKGKTKYYNLNELVVE